METIFKTRPNVPLQSLKCRDDCSIVLAFKIDCRPKYDSSIEIKASCRAHRVWVKFQLNRPSCRPVHTLGSPVPCLAAAGGCDSLSPTIKASHGQPWLSATNWNKPCFGERRSSRREISPASFLSFPLTPLSPQKFGVCCLLLT